MVAWGATVCVCMFYQIRLLCLKCLLGEFRACRNLRGRPSPNSKCQKKRSVFGSADGPDYPCGVIMAGVRGCCHETLFIALSLIEHHRGLYSEPRTLSRSGPTTFKALHYVVDFSLNSPSSTTAQSLYI